MDVQTATCRQCGHEFEYETCGSPLLANFAPRICGTCGQKAADAELAERTAERRLERNIPPRYADADFASFTPKSTTQRQALEAARDHAMEGVFLSGAPGSGKTHLACAAVMAGPLGSLFVSTTDLLDDIRAGFDGDGQGLYERAKRAPLLALDDLGSEAVTDWVRDRLYVLLNTRWNNSAPMIVTTNCAPRVITERIGKAGVSRLAMCRHRIDITGAPDGRRGLQVAS